MVENINASGFYRWAKNSSFRVQLIGLSSKVMRFKTYVDENFLPSFISKAPVIEIFRNIEDKPSIILKAVIPFNKVLNINSPVISI